MKRCSFTLFEIILSIAILSVILGGTVMAWSNGMKMKEVSERHVEQTFSKELFLKYFGSDIDNIALPGVVFTGDFVESADEDHDLVHDTLTFYTARSRVTSGDFGGDYIHVDYLLVEDETTARYSLQRHVYSNLYSDDEEEPVEQTLLENVVGLQFDYFGNGSDWVEGWDTSLSEEFPKAIKVTVYYYADEKAVEKDEVSFFRLVKLIDIEK